MPEPEKRSVRKAQEELSSSLEADLFQDSGIGASSTPIQPSVESKKRKAVEAREEARKKKQAEEMIRAEKMAKQAADKLAELKAKQNAVPAPILPPQPPGSGDQLDLLRTPEQGPTRKEEVGGASRGAGSAFSTGAAVESAVSAFSAGAAVGAAATGAARVLSGAGVEAGGQLGGEESEAVLVIDEGSTRVDGHAAEVLAQQAQLRRDVQGIHKVIDALVSDIYKDKLAKTAPQAARASFSAASGPAGSPAAVGQEIHPAAVGQPGPSGGAGQRSFQAVQPNFTAAQASFTAAAAPGLHLGQAGMPAAAGYMETGISQTPVMAPRTFHQAAMTAAAGSEQGSSFEEGEIEEENEPLGPLSFDFSAKSEDYVKKSWSDWTEADIEADRSKIKLAVEKLRLRGTTDQVKTSELLVQMHSNMLAMIRSINILNQATEGGLTNTRAELERHMRDMNQVILGESTLFPKIKFQLCFRPGAQYT